MTPLLWLLAIVAVPLTLAVEALGDREQRASVLAWFCEPQQPGPRGDAPRYDYTRYEWVVDGDDGPTRFTGRLAPATLRRHRRDADRRGQIVRAEGLNWRLAAPPNDRREGYRPNPSSLPRSPPPGSTAIPPKPCGGRNGGAGLRSSGRIGVGRGGYRARLRVDPRSVIIPSSPSGVTSSRRRPAPSQTQPETR